MSARRQAGLPHLLAESPPPRLEPSETARASRSALSSRQAVCLGSLSAGCGAGVALNSRRWVCGIPQPPESAEYAANRLT